MALLAFLLPARIAPRKKWGLVMEIGSQIREDRARLSLSQDALAERVYVSRQTISSWENDKTYPDVQSLLLGATMTWLLWQQDEGWSMKSAPTLVLVALAGVATVATEMRLGSLWNDLDLKTHREVLDYAQGRTVRRESKTSKMARGSVSDRILHFLPYLAVIMTAGYMLGRLAKVIVNLFF